MIYGLQKKRMNFVHIAHKCSLCSFVTRTAGAVLASSYAETLRGWDMPVIRAVVAKRSGVHIFLLLLLLFLLLFLLLTQLPSELFRGVVWTWCMT